MKNTLITSVFIFLFQLIIQGQVVGGQYNKLFDDYIIGNYEDCLNRALKLTEKDKTRREAEPYLYVAMVYTKYYNDPDYLEIEKDDLLKDALKYAAKFVKYDAKDENSNLMAQNKEPINEIERITVELAQFFYVEENYRKTAYYLKKSYKMKENPQVLMALANAQILSRSIREGERSFNLALEQISEQKIPFEGNTLLADLLAKSFKKQIDFLKANNESALAEQMIKSSGFYLKNAEQITSMFN